MFIVCSDFVQNPVAIATKYEVKQKILYKRKIIVYFSMQKFLFFGKERGYFARKTCCLIKFYILGLS